MPVEKAKLLYRIFRSEAEERGMDMKKFYYKRRKGLMPFLNSNGDVEWLKRNEFRIAAAKKINHMKKSKKIKNHRHSHHHEDADSTGPITPEMYKYFFVGLLGAIVVYVLLRLLAVF